MDRPTGLGNRPMPATMPGRPSRLTSTVRGIARRGRFRDVRTYCMFIGYGRSGHSLLGALLDAHPRMVISHELDALALIARGYGRLALFDSILAYDTIFTNDGRQWMGYDYEVPGQWQGRFDVLEVIGDKKGGDSTLWLAQDPGLLGRLRQTVQLPLRLIHHVRNPFDNITTIAQRNNLSLEAAVDRYLGLCNTVSSVLAGCDDEEVVETHQELFVEQPREELARICRFLGQDATPDYLDACVSVVFGDPRRTRHQADWTPDLLRRVEAAITTHPFLNGYEP